MISRQGILRLLEVVLRFLGQRADAHDYMFNRVIEVSEDGMIRAYVRTSNGQN